MKNCDEMVDSLLKRRTAYERKKHKRQQIMIGLTPIAIGLVIVGTRVALAKFEPKSVVSETTTVQNTTSENTTAPTDVTENPTDSSDVSIIKPTEYLAIMLYDTGDKKLSVNGSLYQALTNNPRQTYKIRATYRPTTSAITSFTYEGQTLSEIAIAADEEWLTYQKMSTLLKLGDELKYGTILYETGAPDGTKWAKELYESTVTQLGSKLISTYIVNGTFKKDELQKDIDNFSYPAKVKYEGAFSAYMKTIIPKAQKKLADNNLLYEEGTDKDNIIFYANADNIKSVDFDDLSNWLFYLDESIPEITTADLSLQEQRNIEEKLCDIVYSAFSIDVPNNSQSQSTLKIRNASYYGRGKVLISQEDYNVKLGFAISHTVPTTSKKVVTDELTNSSRVIWNSYYSEETVKETYNKIFGVNSYKGFGEVGEIYYHNLYTYTYDPEIKGFVITSNNVYSDDTHGIAQFSFSRITDTTAALYFKSAISTSDTSGQSVVLNFGEYVKQKVGDKASYIALNIDANHYDDIFSNALSEYDLFKFTFEKDSAGNYVFTSYEQIDVSEWLKR